ncbi:SRPBCC domain-containing protein [Cyclobacterium sp. 1_MG-2023]|uniref:SRPBCC family protein n=1 Tax=Cyclobacterium sp. 1_MG-2023 TaxID=3062681 RepID=UPI0026E36969|nr:SRPBCC domain-containing protein [Cyclobacterium sp. 1_MG-2023]MDO6437336.1 SRPBCC domain-containing protein [Cyclobacterium sp. 1_MG-2023]
MESIEHINYIKSPKDKVYQTLTTEQGLGEIWTRRLKVKPEVGFVNEFDFDEGYITKFKILELKEHSKIIWECTASDEQWLGTKVSFELTEKDNATTIRLKHYDWEERTEYYGWCNYNWAMFLYRLKGYCESQTNV